MSSPAAVALDEHGVESPSHRRQGMGAGQHGGMHPDRDLGGVYRRRHHRSARPRPSSFTTYPRRSAKAMSTGSTVRDALGRGDVRHRHVAAEGQRRQDGRLGGGVVPVHIGAGVALGEAQALRLGQRLVYETTLLRHRRQDEVGRAVDDPHDPTDPLAGQGLTKGPDEGDGPRHGRLVEEVDPGRRGGIGQGRPVGGEQTPCWRSPPACPRPAPLRPSPAPGRGHR